MARILEHAGRDSLVIVDELGRGTSAEEGLALCIAVCEQLMGAGATALLATHFRHLARLQLLYPFVTSCHMESSLKGAPPLLVPHFTFKVLRRSMETTAADGDALALTDTVDGLQPVAQEARRLLPDVQVYRKELAVEATIARREMQLAQQLRHFVQSPAALTVTEAVADQLQQLRLSYSSACVDE